MKVNLLIAALLLLGVVEYIYPDIILVSYKHGSKTKFSEVSRSQSVCEPVAGQQVYFLKDYKILTCEEPL
jgi:hypothetical protein